MMKCQWLEAFHQCLVSLATIVVEHLLRERPNAFFGEGTNRDILMKAYSMPGPVRNFNVKLQVKPFSINCKKKISNLGIPFYAREKFHFICEKELNPPKSYKNISR